MKAVMLSISRDTAEMEDLARVAGYNIAGLVFQARRHPDPNHYFGSGKLAEVRAGAGPDGIEAAIVNDTLRPNQHYNIEQALAMPVRDRVGIILEIFAKRAHRKDAKLQIELARYHYELPFVREWIHRAKKGEHPGYMAGGGYQTDQYLEYIRRRVKSIKEELRRIESQKDIARRRRADGEVFTVGIAGYTNAGKSSLLRALTGTDVEIADDLFTTLDTTTRRLAMQEKKERKEQKKAAKQIIVTDTIGFISNLPPWLVASFRSTLDETRLADCVLLVIDGSENPETLQQKAALSLSILRVPENGPEESPAASKAIIILNKIDKIKESDLEEKTATLRSLTGLPVFAASAATGAGIAGIVQELSNRAGSPRKISMRNAGVPQG